MKAIRIGLQVDSIDPYWVEVRETIWRICRPASEIRSRRDEATNQDEPAIQIDDGPTIELIEFELNVVGDHADTTTTKVEELMALELDAAIVVPGKLEAIHGVLERGLPVIALIDRDIKHPLFTSPHELSASAEIACAYIADQLAGNGCVLIAGGRLHVKREQSSSRVLAALELFDRYDDIQTVHVATPWDYHGAVQVLHRALEKDAQRFNAIFGLSDTLALAALDVCSSAGVLDPNATVVGINGDPLAITSIAEGDMTATVATSAADIALNAVNLARHVALGGQLPDKFNYEPILIDRDNVAEFALTKLSAIAAIPSRLVGVNREHEAQRAVELETSLAINRTLGQFMDRDQLSLEIAELIRRNYGFDDVQIFLWQEESQSLVLDRPGIPDVERTKIKLDESVALGHALIQNRPVFIPDTERSQRFPPDPRWSSTKSRVIVPLRLGKETMGLLDLHSRRLQQRTRIELEALQSLCDQLGVAIRNSELYAEALAARAEAEQASHLKTRLLANVSHQLRAPLNVILGYSQIALSEPNPYGTALPRALRSDLSHIEHSGQHLVHLINDLLDLSLAETGALELFTTRLEPQSLLLQTFERAKETMRSDLDAVEWRLELPDELPEIEADPIRLEQIILNLLSNAAKFTERGHITLGAAANTSDLQIWVSDTGTGISPEHLAVIFESFDSAHHTEKRPDRARTGLGLGLSVTYRLVTLQGGRIQIQSDVGIGTVCELLFPIALSNGQQSSDTEERLDRQVQTLQPLLDRV